MIEQALKEANKVLHQLRRAELELKVPAYQKQGQASLRAAIEQLEAGIRMIEKLRV